MSMRMCLHALHCPCYLRVHECELLSESSIAVNDIAC